MYRRSMQSAESPSPVQSAVTGLRFNAEGAAVGAILGFIQGEFGSLDVKGVPIDGIAAFLLYLLSVRETGKPDGFASDLRALSQSCTTVLAYRKVQAWRESTHEVQTSIPRNKNVDPILAAGKAAGL
jgi:hypothetical protein